MQGENSRDSVTDVLAKQSVLMVDDNPMNISVLVEAFREDFDLRVARSGEETLKIAQSDDPPDLILLDVMMPEMDGYEVCRRLKADPKTVGIAVVFVTARTDSEAETYGLQLGAADYITKPFHIPIVRQRVRNHLMLKIQRDRLLDQKSALEKALAEIKVLRGFLPICSNCKQVRDDQGYWTEIEAYLGLHSEAEFSHSVCPRCAKKLYPDFYKEMYPHPRDDETAR